MTSRKITIPKPVAELRRWQLSGDRAIRGFIANSTSKAYANESYYVISNFKHMTHYPQGKDTGEYWLVFQHTNECFICYKSEMMPSIPTT